MFSSGSFGASGIGDTVGVLVSLSPNSSEKVKLSVGFGFSATMGEAVAFGAVLVGVREVAGFALVALLAVVLAVACGLEYMSLCHLDMLLWHRFSFLFLRNGWNYLDKGVDL